jgi:hypothetical protein
MDTRFWGPSGWKLLHLIAAEPIENKCHAIGIQKWFQLLEYVLPCKYCRASFHQYVRLQPLTLEIVMDNHAFGRWVYDIHNRVNDKLRGQGLLTTPNPSWKEVHEQYTALHKTLCDGTPLLGWDFLTSVAFSTPAKDYKPIPMPDTPEEYQNSRSWAALDKETKNRYNLLTREERLPSLKLWWRLLPVVLPCKFWRAAWDEAMHAAGMVPLQRGRNAVMRWMWRIEENVCSELRCPTPHSSLPALQKEVSAFESGCSVARRGKTCRTLRKKQRSKVHKQRTRKGVRVL